MSESIICVLNFDALVFGANILRHLCGAAPISLPLNVAGTGVFRTFQISGFHRCLMHQDRKSRTAPNTLNSSKDWVEEFLASGKSALLSFS